MSEYDTAPLEFIPKLWATRKVGFLLDQIRVNGEKKELKDEVVRLAKKFGLVTPYTSYLAVDDSELEGRQPRAEREQQARQNRANQQRAQRQRRRRSRPNTKDDDRSRNLVDGLSGGGGSSTGSQAEAAPRPERRRRSRSSSRGFGGFGKSTGKSAVRASEETRRLKEADKVDDEKSSKRRWVSGKTFALTGGVWVQEGLKKDAKATKVKMYSKKYFQLVRKHPELGKIAKLGDKVLVKLAGTVYRIVPEK